MIPHKIHHIWLQGGIPEKYLDNFNLWKEMHPTWVQKVWDEDALLALCTKDQKETYSKLDTFINKVNYLKYILMYHEGGVFTDLDTYPLKRLELLFEEDELKDIDINNLLSIRHPYNTEIPKLAFKHYKIILPGRKTLSHYPNGDNLILLDNPILMSIEKHTFWLKLINWCEKRTNLKPGGLSNTKYLPHEPYGPYGMSDYIYHNHKHPYLDKILILPPTYLMADAKDLSNNMYIVHAADAGW